MIVTSFLTPAQLAPQPATDQPALSLLQARPAARTAVTVRECGAWNESLLICFVYLYIYRYRGPQIQCLANLCFCPLVIKQLRVSGVTMVTRAQFGKISSVAQTSSVLSSVNPAKIPAFRPKNHPLQKRKTRGLYTFIKLCQIRGKIHHLLTPARVMNNGEKSQMHGQS